MDPQIQQLIRAVNRLQRLVMLLWVSFLIVLAASAIGVLVAITAIQKVETRVNGAADKVQSAAGGIQLPNSLR